jgi:hypothetical protein
VPFDIWITRDAGLPMEGRPPTSPISSEEVEASFGTSPVRRRQDGAWWVSRPDTNDPWFAAVIRNGHVVLSCSYTNHRFVANFVDAFDIALRLASRLRARVVEEVRDQEVSGTDIDDLLAPNGDYLALQVQTFRAAVEQMDTDAGGPLEWPLDQVDSVSEYCLFRMAVSDGVELESVASLADPLLFRSAGPGIGTMVDVDADPGTEIPLVKLMKFRDGAIQAWPVHGRGPFALSAEATFRIATHSEIDSIRL